MSQVSGIFDAATIVLVALGAGLVGLRLTWRGVALGLGLQYAGVVVHLLATSGWFAALATALVAAGVEALLLLQDRARLASLDDAPARDNEPATPPEAEPPVESSRRARAARVRAGRGGESRRPWFDLSVIGLAVVGAIALAISRPLTGNAASDAIVNILMLTGLLYCLIGQPVRVAGGLLLVTSAGNVLLRAADPTVTSGETLVFAVAQLALVLALVQWEAPRLPEEQAS